MSATPTSASHKAGKRASFGGYLWFIGVAGLWTAFGVVALRSTEKLADLWNWVVGLAVVEEIAVWIVLFPWVLGLWVSQTSWAEWLRILLVVSFAVGWTLLSIPRRRISDSPARTHWGLRSGHPRDGVVTQRGVRSTSR
jgi:hypothetical protein